MGELSPTDRVADTLFAGNALGTMLMEVRLRGLVTTSDERDSGEKAEEEEPVVSMREAAGAAAAASGDTHGTADGETYTWSGRGGTGRRPRRAGWRQRPCQDNKQKKRLQSEKEMKRNGTRSGKWNKNEMKK